MADPTWPNGVNDKVLLGEIEQPVDNVVRSEIDQGVPKTRRRWTLPLARVDFDQIMTMAEYALFVNWWENTIAGGATPFQIRLPSSGQLARFQFRNVYRANMFSDNAYRVTLNLVQIP